MAKTDFKTIDEYISTFPENVLNKLEQIRQTIRKAAHVVLRRKRGAMTQLHNSKL